MKAYAGKHPVYVSHTAEVEKVAFFVAGLQQRLQARGKDSGEKYDCLLKIGRRCAELLLRMYAEDDDIMLMDDLDYHWVRKIVACANGLLKDVPGAV